MACLRQRARAPRAAVRRAREFCRGAPRRCAGGRIETEPEGSTSSKQQQQEEQRPRPLRSCTPPCQSRCHPSSLLPLSLSVSLYSLDHLVLTPEPACSTLSQKPSLREPVLAVRSTNEKQAPSPAEPSPPQRLSPPDSRALQILSSTPTTTTIPPSTPPPPLFDSPTTPPDPPLTA